MRYCSLVSPLSLGLGTNPLTWSPPSPRRARPRPRARGARGSASPGTARGRPGRARPPTRIGARAIGGGSSSRRSRPRPRSYASSRRLASRRRLRLLLSLLLLPLAELAQDLELFRSRLDRARFLVALAPHDREARTEDHEPGHDRARDQRPRGRVLHADPEPVHDRDRRARPGEREGLRDRPELLREGLGHVPVVVLDPVEGVLDRERLLGGVDELGRRGRGRAPLLVLRRRAELVLLLAAL